MLPDEPLVYENRLGSPGGKAFQSINPVNAVQPSGEVCPIHDLPVIQVASEDVAEHLPNNPKDELGQIDINKMVIDRYKTSEVTSTPEGAGVSVKGRYPPNFITNISYSRNQPHPGVDKIILFRITLLGGVRFKKSGISSRMCCRFYQNFVIR